MTNTEETGQKRIKTLNNAQKSSEPANSDPRLSVVMRKSATDLPADVDSFIRYKARFTKDIETK